MAVTIDTNPESRVNKLVLRDTDNQERKLMLEGSATLDEFANALDAMTQLQVVQQESIVKYAITGGVAATGRLVTERAGRLTFECQDGSSHPYTFPALPDDVFNKDKSVDFSHTAFDGFRALMAAGKWQLGGSTVIRFVKGLLV